MQREGPGRRGRRLQSSRGAGPAERARGARRGGCGGPGTTAGAGGGGVECAGSLGLPGGARAAALSCLPVRRILMLEPFLRVPGFDISRQRPAGLGSSAAAPQPGPARPRRRLLKVTATGWAPGSEPGRRVSGAGVGTGAAGWSRRTERSAAPPPGAAPGRPSTEPPRSQPDARRPRCFRRRLPSCARARCRAGPALRGPALACVRAPEEHGATPAVLVLSEHARVLRSCKASAAGGDP